MTKAAIATALGSTLLLGAAAPAMGAWAAPGSGTGRAGSATLGQVTGLASTFDSCTPPAGSGITDSNNKMFVTISWAALTNAASYGIAASVTNANSSSNGIQPFSGTSNATSTTITLSSKGTGGTYNITVSGKAGTLWSGAASTSISVASRAC